jgi:ABC-type phosphate transport system substrate-binding protein
MLYLRVFYLWLVFLQLLGMGNCLLADTIHVAGSDFAGEAMGLKPGAEQKTGDNLIVYNLTGSYIGLLKVKDGFADVAFVLQAAGGQPALDELAAVPIGFWGIYFAVEESNPLNEVSMDSLTDVLRKTKDGLKSEWGTLIPHEPKWTNRIVFVSFDVKQNDPSFPVLLNGFFNNEVPQHFSSMGEKMENPYLAGASHLMVMSRLPQPGKGLRSLAIIPDGQSVGFPPSAESMFYGDYPLRTMLYVVVRDSKDPKVRAFLTDLFSGNRLKLLEKSGLIPVPNNVRKQALLGFDLDF